MAISLSFRSLFRSVLYRYGGLQQIQSRPLCKGPPDDFKDIKKDAESSSSDEEDTDVSKRANLENKEAKAEVHLEQDVKEAEKPKRSIADEKRAAAKKKLNDLLISLATADPVPVEPISRLKLSRPNARPKASKKKEKEAAEEETVHSSSPSSEDIHIEPELVVATQEVAESLGGDVKVTESELLSTLRSHASESSSNDKPTTNLSELFVGMKVERSRSSPMIERRRHGQYDRHPSSQPQSALNEESRYRMSSRPRLSREFASVDLFGSKTLGIFDIKKDDDSKPSIGESVLPVWDETHHRELQLNVTHPPANAFVEMIQWTRQGKLWTFPINNEVGLEDEKKVGFHEHVFLEHHLEGWWCPRRGPVRHFMELVCTGLSKNPHLTVERKIRHIHWYKDYFEAKQEVLKEIGAIEAQS